MPSSRDEVDRLLRANFMREAHYPNWLANPILVKQKSDKWRICIDFTKLNLSLSQRHLLPIEGSINRWDATAGHELLSFMNA